MQLGSQFTFRTAGRVLQARAAAGAEAPRGPRWGWCGGWEEALVAACGQSIQAVELDEGGGQGPPGISGLCLGVGVFRVTWHPIGALNLGALHDPPTNCGVEGRPGRPGLRLAEPWRSRVCRWLLAGLRAGASRGAASSLVGCFPAALAKKAPCRAHRHGRLRFMSSVFFINCLTQAWRQTGRPGRSFTQAGLGPSPGDAVAVFTHRRACGLQTDTCDLGRGGGWGLSRNPRAALCGWWLEISTCG